MKLQNPGTKLQRSSKSDASNHHHAVRGPLVFEAWCFSGAWSLLLGALLVTSVSAATYHNPVLAGDYPDPSVIRVGDEYWATATTSEWAPLFPLLHSRDLVNWEHVGNIFERRPDWAVGNFWAPELHEHKGRLYVYYVGRKRGGPLHLAVATANKPTGPWQDHGPLIGQEAGSIDAFPVTDVDGTRYLIWKEDGNSRKQPTPLWIQKLSDDGLKLVGEMKEVFRNDTTWENNLVEGPAVIRRGEYWYLFYAANACCGRACSYGVGVARAKNLLGPWEKYSNNPIVLGNDTWKCPGHGTLVRDKSGHDWFLYHAYNASAFIYVGRQGVLDRVNWHDDGWPVINERNGPSAAATTPLPGAPQQPPRTFSDQFVSVDLKPQWQWPQNLEPRTVVGNGKLVLSPGSTSKDEFASSVLAVKTTSGDYTASTELSILSVKPSQTAGLAAYGDRENALGVSVRGRELVVWKRQRNKHEVVATSPLPRADQVFLRMTAIAGHKFSFSASGDGNAWKSVGENVDVEGAYLPPWDRGIRVALVVGGEDPAAEFRSLQVADKR